MTSNPTRILLIGLLGACLASPASASTDGTRLEVDLIEQGGRIVAVAYLSHAEGLPLELDLSYTVNGELVKVEPVDVFGPTAYIEILGPNDRSYSVCAAYEGIVRASAENNWWTEGQDCDLRLSHPVMSPPLEQLVLRAVDARRPGRRSTEGGRPILPDPLPRPRR